MDIAESEPARSSPLTHVSKIAFLLLVASLGFVQIPITGQKIVFTDILFLLAGALWLGTLISGRRQIHWHKFYWLLSFYLATLFISCLFSSNRPVSFARFPTEVYLAGLSVLTFSMLESRSDFKHAIYAWFAGSAFAAVTGLLTILLFYTSPENSLLESLTYHYGAVPVGNYPRITATFVSASMFCNYLNVSLILALVAKGLGWLEARIAWPFIIALFVCSLFTISVGLGGIFLGLGVWIWYVGNEPRRLFSRVALLGGIGMASGFLLLAIFAINPYPGGTVVGNIPFTNIPLMPSGRVLVWKDAIHTFSENFLTGKGLGLPIANVIFTNTDGTLSLLTDAHNSFLSVAAQSGVSGLAALILISVYIVRGWARKNSTKIATYGISLAFLCSFVYQGLTGSFEEARHLWVLVGFFLAAGRIKTSAD
jgi:hypothetical protein